MAKPFYFFGKMFLKGQNVYCLISGDGVVTDIKSGDAQYPIVVYFSKSNRTL
jgi:hypothetical protein